MEAKKKVKYVEKREYEEMMKEQKNTLHSPGGIKAEEKGMKK